MVCDVSEHVIWRSQIFDFPVIFLDNFLTLSPPSQFTSLDKLIVEHNSRKENKNDMSDAENKSSVALGKRKQREDESAPHGYVHEPKLSVGHN
jgi:hypothetical protein